MKRIHYAWVVCGCGLLAMLCNLGLCSNIIAAYLPFIEKTGISDAQGSMIVSVRCFSSFLCTFFVTQYYKKFSLRTGLALATLTGAAGAAILSVGGSAWVYWLGAAVMGLAYGFGTMIPISLLMTGWFSTARATAISVCSAGTGLASILFAPLITTNTLKHGLRSTFLLQAGFMALCALTVLLLVRNDPEEIAAQPFGAGAEKEAGPRGKEIPNADFELPRGIRILMLAMLGILGGCGVAASGHVSVVETTAGYSAAAGGMAATLYGFALMAGKLSFGPTADRLGARRASIIYMLIFCTAGCTSLLLNGKNMLFACLFPLLLGIGCAFFTIGMPLWSADLAAPKDFSRLLRDFQIMYAAGGIVLGAVPGSIADVTHEYRSSYAGMAAGVAIGLGLLLYFYKRRKTEYKR